MLALSDVTIEAFAFAIEYSGKQYLKLLHNVHIELYSAFSQLLDIEGFYAFVS